MSILFFNVADLCADPNIILITALRQICIWKFGTFLRKNEINRLMLLKSFFFLWIALMKLMLVSR